ncbi:phytanoyl-CoA dioxygenase family protein [Sphingomonas sp. QA11]|uniref:phytanoyl-CoA dioxygenase family protein n=1 Tax=Sphingomonas sp. QA11 TaxID=2950605 RepID=UPI00234BDEE0|nr:phytanoyl-CoA dioxygenase family protein [Sphingomonas sp. QA11]WCM28285.1 phytanoyl-CoA dioxygenase family protein [Sphingomonas sp. QA11]
MQNSMEKYLYEFDAMGATVFRNAISPDQISLILREWEETFREQKLFDIPFSGDTPWKMLIDHPGYFEFISHIFHGRPRLDHAFGVTEKFNSSKGNLHHDSTLFDRGIYHVERGGQLHVGLVGISISLTEIPSRNGGFCYIPGSHKSYVRTPEFLSAPDENELVTQIPQAAGDVIVFSEALTHGTFPSTSAYSRRSIIMRYAPCFLAFRRPSEDRLTRLPLTPNYEHSDKEGVIDPSSLSARQFEVAALRPFSRGREAVTNVIDG